MPGPSLAKLGAPLPFGGALTAIIIVALALVAWNFLRRRNATWSAVVLLVAALLIIGCFVPATTYEDRGVVTGRFGGTLLLHPALRGDSSLKVDNGGSGELRAATASLTCPTGARCSFVIEPASLFVPDAQGNIVEGNVTLEAHGGPVQMTDTDRICYQVAFTLRLLGGSSCVVCRATDFVVPEGVDGAASATPSAQALPDPC